MEFSRNSSKKLFICKLRSLHLQQVFSQLCSPTFALFLFLLSFLFHKNVRYTGKNYCRNNYHVQLFPFEKNFGCCTSKWRPFLKIVLSFLSDKDCLTHSQVWNNFWQLEKNAFYFTLKAYFVLKIFNFFSWRFSHVEKRLY